MIPICLILITKEDKEKFEYLYEKYKNLMYAYAFRILKDSSSAEDAVHETYYRIAKNLSKIDNKSSRKTVNFMITIVKHVSYSMYKKIYKNKIVSFDESEYEDINNFYTIDEIIARRLDYAELLKIIKSLDDKYKYPLILKYGNDFSISQIAIILDMKESTVSTRINRAKEKVILEIGRKEANK